MEEFTETSVCDIYQCEKSERYPKSNFTGHDPLNECYVD